MTNNDNQGTSSMIVTRRFCRYLDHTSEIGPGGRPWLAGWPRLVDGPAGHADRPAGEAF